MKKFIQFLGVGLLMITIIMESKFVPVKAQSIATTFAVIGDYGVNNEYEAAVATMVSIWNPNLVLGLGDGYYTEAGGIASDKYDFSTGKYYCSFLKDINTTGTFCPVGQSSTNRFFPALGDHDYADGGTTNGLPTTYTDYFNLPGNGYTSSSNNERYYDFVSGPVHFFVMNTDDAEPDGYTSTSVQAQWLQAQLAASTSVWNVVVMPSPPYSSGATHGSTPSLQWPFAQWGADVVFSGDDHIYERILRDGIVYFVNGLGGQWPYPLNTPVQGSVFRYNASHGAQRVIASDTSMTFEFYTVDNGSTLRDSYTIYAPGVPTPETTSQPGNINVRVGTSTDDAEMNMSDGTMSLYSPDLELADDIGLAREQLVGIRFSNISIPQGAVITNAYIEFEVISANLEATSLIIQAEASDNAATFKNLAFNLSNRPRTNAAISWDNIPAWTVTGSKQQTPNLAMLVQEVVNRPSWVTGNGMGFIFDGSGTRTAISYDSSPASAPILHVEFEQPATATPSITPTSTPVSTGSGWNSPAAQSFIKNFGDQNGFEVSPKNIFLNDGAFAMDIDSGTTVSTSCGDSGKDRHKYYNYNISIPSTSIIQGIEVRLDAKTDSTVGSPKICASVSWDNGISWSPWKSTPTLTASEVTYNLGGQTDNWGRSWTSTEFSNSTFQVRVANVASDNARDFSLDWVGVHVTYVALPTSTPTLTNTPPPSTATFTATPTFTPGPTSTATVSPTFTSTPTLTYTPTLTATVTAAPNTSNTSWRTPASQSAASNGDANGLEVTPSNALTDDGLFAMDMDSGTTTSTSCSDTGKDRHKFTTYNISIPEGSTIQGIEVRLDAKTDSTVGAPKICVSISKDNALTWTSWKSSTPLTTDEVTYILGGSADLWGTTWLPSNLTNSNFQVRIANVSSNPASDFSLDLVAVNVTYISGPTATVTYTPTPTTSSTVTNTPTVTNTATMTPTPSPTLTTLSSGWYSPSSQSTASSGDGNGFEVNPINAFIDDNLFAMDMDSGTNTSTSCSDTGKDRHRFLNYNISIAEGSTIRGIEIRLDAKVDSTIGTPKICVAVSKDNALTWTSWKGSTPLTTDEAAYILGGPADLWGVTWLPANLANGIFQVRVADISSNSITDFSLDWIAVNITYSP